MDKKREKIAFQVELKLANNFLGLLDSFDKDEIATLLKERIKLENKLKNLKLG